MYAPRNMDVPVKRNTKTNNFEEDQKMTTKKESIPTSKGYIAPKKDKDFVKSNYVEAAEVRIYNYNFTI